MTQCNGLFELMLAMHVRLDKLEQRLLGDVGKERKRVFSLDHPFVVPPAAP